ncbi:response regulator [Marinobacter sp. NSM]|uniref:response regulator n=1 Tax=Marinobacter sp. NSM TaxID=3458004 RepID=UPI004035E63E
MNTQRKYILITVFSVIAVSLLGAFWGWKVLDAKRELRETLQQREEMVEMMKAALTLRQVMGHGGLIHHYNAFVQHRDTSHQERLQYTFRLLALVESRLKRLIKDPDILDIVNRISILITENRTDFELIKQLSDEGWATELVDQTFKIDEVEIFQLLEKLELALQDQYSNSEQELQRNIGSVRKAILMGSYLFIPMMILCCIFLLLLRRMNNLLVCLDDSKKAVDLLLETAPDSVLTVDDDGNILRANATAQTYFGYGNQIVGKKLEDLIPTPPGALTAEPEHRVYAKLADGENREVSVRRGFFDSAQGRAAVVSVRDISEEGQFKNGLIEAQRRIDFAAYVAKFGIWELDTVKGYLSLDLWSHRLHNIALGELSGNFESWLKIIHPEDSKLVQQAVDRAKSSDIGVECSYRIMLGEEVRWLQLVAGAQCDDDGNVICLTGVCRDVTEMTETQQALEIANERALAATRSKADFLANMSHEIRTPMNAVLGLLTLLERSSRDNRQVQLVKTAHESASGLLNVLDDILEFSKLEAGKVNLSIKAFELEDVLRKAVDLFAPLAHQKGLEFVLDVDPNLPDTMVGDSFRLGQVLSNLVSNAIKFTHRGSVVLQVSADTPSNGSVFVNFSVRDTGIGMSQEQIDVVTAPFVQGHEGMCKEFGGSGLGLSICNYLLSLFDSRLEIHSYQRRGTYISFGLTLALGQEASLISAWRLKPCSVLMLCDNVGQGNILGKFLREWSASVTFCRNVREAKLLLEQGDESFDYLLADFGQRNAVEVVLRFLKAWNEANPVNSQNIILIHKSYSDDILGRCYGEFKPRFIYSPPTPGRLFEAFDTEHPDGVGIQSHRDSLAAAIDIARPCRGARILVVEDVKNNQLIAEEFLSQLGMQVAIANDGNEAINKLSEQAFDCVLMDIQIPNLDGIQTARLIRQLPAIENLPIIAMTAAVTDSDKERAREAGMVDHISKPIDVVEMASILVRHITVSNSTANGEPSPHADHPSLITVSNPDASSEQLPESIDPVLVKHRFGDRKELYTACIRAFRNDFADWSRMVNTAEKEKDLKAVSSLLHKLKGGAANIGANDLVNSITKVPTPDQTSWQPALAAVKQSLELLLIEITDSLIKTSGPPSESFVRETGEDIVFGPEFLQTLRASIKGNQYIPAKLINTLEGQIGRSQEGERIKSLQAHLEQFDYGEALKTIDEIIKAVKSQSPDQ